MDKMQEAKPLQVQKRGMWRSDLVIYMPRSHRNTSVVSVQAPSEMRITIILP